MIDLRLGDCLELLREIPDGSVDAVVTDPPYGVSFRGKNTKHTTRNDLGYSELEDTEDNVRDFVVPIIEECIRRFGRVVVTPGVRCMSFYPRPDDIGCVYCPSGAGSGRWGFVTHHPILFYGACPYLEKSMGSRPNGFSSTEAAKPNGHPCPKPIGWMNWLVTRSSLRGETILDPFMGSGTTGVACLNSWRNFIGIERDPVYFAIAEKRIASEEARYAMFSEPEADADEESRYALFAGCEAT